MLVDEMWAALAIASMWIAVLFTAVFGPDMVFTSGSGASTTTIPSAVVVAFFAWLGTRALARPAFGRRERED
ncbi:MAG: hypothetical protein HZB46_19165 [Solirubrobacterales bacterium]|nr:hypothetical protein [Solirubrobacterales bacterium]